MNFLTYLKYCFHNFRTLFWMIAIVFIGSLTTAFVTSYTIWPFFSYGLYSFPEKDKPFYQAIEIKINGNAFLFYKELPTGVAANIENETINYIFLKRNSYTDSFYYKIQEKTNFDLPSFLDPIFKYENLTDREFSMWLKRYLEHWTDFEIYKLELNELTLQYTPKVKIIAKEKIFEEDFRR